MIKNVMSRVAERRATRARIWAIFHGLLSIAAIVALIPAYQYLADSAASSGFSAYLSLMASDGSSLLHSWRAFGLTLAESAPFAGIVLVLGALLVLAYGARKTATDWGRMRVNAVVA
jgi:hypothetical protein